jgi:hypothetical protein
MFGYKLGAAETIPAAFQRLDPHVQVLNLAINNLQTGSSYLIGKQIIDSVDTLYVLMQGNGAMSNLAQLIDVDVPDRERFGLEAPNSLETALRGYLGFWKLYRNAYRLQNAAFGASTRMYVYQNKAVWARAAARGLLGQPSSPGHTMPLPTDAPTANAPPIAVSQPVAAAAPTPERAGALARKHPVIWDFGTLAAAHEKRLILLDFIVHSKELPDADVADFNAYFGPQVTMVQLTIPEALVFDSQHLTAEGSRLAARALVEWQRSSGHAP